MAKLKFGELTSPKLQAMNDWNARKEKKYKEQLVPKLNRPASVLAFEVGQLGETNKSLNIDRYYSMGQAQGNVKALDWWKLNQANFPVLSKIARDYLAVQESSVPSEEVFSGEVDLVTPDRNSLSEDTISMSMSLKDWIDNPTVESRLDPIRS
jgi:hypothetical protein